MEKVVNKLGFIVAPNGRKIELIGYDHTEVLYNQLEYNSLTIMPEEHDKLNMIGDFLFPIYKFVQEGAIVFENISANNNVTNEYLNVYLHQNLEYITDEQRQVIEQHYKEIDGYVNHETNLLTDIVDVSIDNVISYKEHNKIFELIKSKTKGR